MAWTLDKSRTKLEFAVRHMMIHTVRGFFRDYDVDLNVDEDDLSQSSVTARIATKSVHTGDSSRDEYLTSVHFFNPDVHPHIIFESTSAQLSGQKVSINGQLKIREFEKPLVLDGTFEQASSGPDEKAKRLVFALKGEIEREAYDLVFHGAVETVSIVVGKKVALFLNIELVES